MKHTNKSSENLHTVVEAPEVTQIIGVRQVPTPGTFPHSHEEMYRFTVLEAGRGPGNEARVGPVNLCQGSISSEQWGF